MSVKEPSPPAHTCATSIRHWFTRHGQVGERRASCGHCGMPHPTILAALKLGLTYANLYTPPEEDPQAAQATARDRAFLRVAIRRQETECAIFRERGRLRLREDD